MSARSWRAGAGRWVRIVGLSVLAAVLAIGDAHATVVEEEARLCAACENAFRGMKVSSSNTYGGIDADGCRNANGEPPWAYLIQVCTHCLAARFPSLAEEAPAGEEAKAFLDRVAQERTVASDARQDEIPNALKYELACGLLKAEKRHPYFRAQLWQYAAWTARGEARAALIHPEHEWDDDVPQVWRDLGADAGERRELVDRHASGARTDVGREVVADQAMAAATPTGPLDAALRRLHLATILRCHGEIVTAEQVLAGIDLEKVPASKGKDDEALPAWVAATKATMAGGLADERELLQRSLDAAAEAGEGVPAPKAGFDRLWGWTECHRRLGNDDEATEGLTRMLAADGMTDALLVLLRDTAEWAGEATPKWRAKVVAAWDQQVADLVAALSDEESAEDASGRLALLADASTLQSLVALLPDEGAGAYAAFAIGGYPPPDAKVIAQMEKLAADPEGDFDLRWNAAGALVAWAEPSSAAVFRALVASEDDDVLREPAIRGLGLTGVQSDVSAILARAEDEPDAAAWALSLLVGRPFEEVDAFAEWWKENGKQEKLAEAALREAGADAERLGDMAAVPTLIALLDNASLPVRWNAYRALQAITAQRFGARELVYVGRVRNPERPDVELDLARVLGDGWTVSYTGTPAFDMDDMGAVLQPMRDRDGRHSWDRAKTQWQHWWDQRKPK